MFKAESPSSIDPARDISYREGPGQPYRIPAPEPKPVEVTTYKTQKQTVLIERPDVSWWVIVGVSLLIIFIAWIALLLLSLRAIPETIATGTATVLTQCSPGQCATNIYNGEKRCPSSPDQIVAAQNDLEFCSAAQQCSNPELPYAVQSDQSTNPLGFCEIDPTTNQPAACRCLASPQCPQYVLAGWQTYTGNAYVGLEGQRTAFTQFVSSSDGTTTPPLKYQDTGLNFCLGSSAWLLRSTPGCPFIDEINADTMAVCMGASQGCDPSKPISNPCSRGTLAFVTNDSAAFDANSVGNTPIGCVQGEPCPCGQIAIYDTQYGGIVCKDLSSSP